MKTNYLLLSLATLAIAGCSQNEITEQNPDADKAIGFGVYTDVQTRGTETVINGIATSGFGVVALTADKSGVHMTERKVSSNDNGTSWTIDSPAYWPADGTSTLNFYAYAPHDADASSGITKTGLETTTPKIGFEIKAMGNMVDLVAAKNEAPTYGASVTMAFKHILSRVAFTASTNINTDNTTITVDKLEFPVISGGEFYKSGTYNLLSEAWESQQVITSTYAIENINAALSSTPASLLGGATNYLFCIPVSNADGTGATNQKIQVNITYTMTSNGQNSTATKTAYIPTGHFKKGQAYKYNFEIGLNAINFSVTSVGSWTETAETDQPLTPA